MSTKHHYIPEFYLKRWAQAGHLIVFKSENGRVSHRRSSPGGTGYVKKLYAVKGLPPETANFVETEFMSQVDSKAALARDALIEQRDPSYKERLAWTKFIISMVLRNPEEFNGFKEHYKKIVETRRPALEAEFLSVRASGMSETYEDYLVRIGEVGRDREMMQNIINAMQSSQMEKLVFEMMWFGVDVSSSSNLLLTSDRPIVWPHKLGRAKAYIAIPISPNWLFVAVRREDVLNELLSRGIDWLVADINRWITGRAVKFVYATDLKQKRFIENRIARFAAPSVVAGMIEWESFSQEEQVRLLPTMNYG